MVASVSNASTPTANCKMEAKESSRAHRPQSLVHTEQETVSNKMEDKNQHKAFLTSMAQRQTDTHTDTHKERQNYTETERDCKTFIPQIFSSKQPSEHPISHRQTDIPAPERRCSEAQKHSPPQSHTHRQRGLWGSETSMKQSGDHGPSNAVSSSAAHCHQLGHTHRGSWGS